MPDACTVHRAAHPPARAGLCLHSVLLIAWPLYNDESLSTYLLLRRLQQLMMVGGVWFVEVPLIVAVHYGNRQRPALRCRRHANTATRARLGRRRDAAAAAVDEILRSDGGHSAPSHRSILRTRRRRTGVRPPTGWFSEAGRVPTSLISGRPTSSTNNS